MFAAADTSLAVALEPCPFDLDMMAALDVALYCEPDPPPLLLLPLLPDSLQLVVAAEVFPPTCPCVAYWADTFDADTSVADSDTCSAVVVVVVVDC